jgi:uncharacterized protein GlcG (DUF336 family)
MKKLAPFISATCLLISGQVFAQTILPNPTAAESGAPRPPRARGISTALAVEAAQSAIATCLTDGNKVTAIIVDSDAVPVAMISGDGAAAITQRIAMGKANISIKTKMSSGDAATKAKADAAFNSMLMGDPSLGVPRPGAILIQEGADIVGALAISGSPTGDKDEACARAGLGKIQARLK